MFHLSPPLFTRIQHRLLESVWYFHQYCSSWCCWCCDIQNQAVSLNTSLSQC